MHDNTLNLLLELFPLAGIISFNCSNDALTALWEFIKKLYFIYPKKKKIITTRKEQRKRSERFFVHLPIVSCKKFGNVTNMQKKNKRR